MIGVLTFVGTLALGVLVMHWIWRRSRRISYVVTAVLGGFPLAALAIGNPSPSTIAIAAYFPLSFTLAAFLYSENARVRGRRRWQGALLFLGIPLILIASALLLFRLDFFVFWALGSLLLACALLLPYWTARQMHALSRQPANHGV